MHKLKLVFKTSIILSIIMNLVYSRASDNFSINSPLYLNKSVIFSNTQKSAIYIANQDTTKNIINSPGCAYYYSLSPDQNLLGFKIINSNRKQTPAIYDIQANEIKALHEPVKNAGQVSFSQTGLKAYTIDTKLHLSDGRRFDLGNYANLAPISPNGKRVAYNDNDDQIWILNLNTNEKDKITNDTYGYYKPGWSPNSQILMFVRLDGTICSYDLNTDQFHIIEKGHSPTWSTNSTHIIYYKKEIEEMKLKNTDLFLAKYDGSEIDQLTNTPDKMEIDPAIINNDSRIIYYIRNNNEIKVANFKKNVRRLNSIVPLFKIKLPREKQIKSLKKNIKTKLTPDNLKSNIKVPYVHQVYDVPDWYWGYYACAPATAAMLLAYYDILPKWTDSCSDPQPHTNDWGRYVCEKYRYNEHYFDDGSSPGGRAQGYGGYGYMWSNGSPSSMMDNYYEIHGLNCNRKGYNNTKWSAVTSNLDAGYPFTMCVWLTGSGHLVLARGYLDGQRTLFFNDPYGDKNTRGYPSYDGKGVHYDWPGYNYGNVNLADAGDGIPWTISAHYNKLAEADTLVDDFHLNKGFYLHTDPPASMKHYYDKKAGINNHHWYTKTRDTGSSTRCYAKWTPDIPEYGNYEILAYIPELNNAANNASYIIQNAKGRDNVIIDQAAQKNKWVSLGIHIFEPGKSGNVILGDSTGNQGKNIVFDAVKFVNRGDLAIDFTTVDTAGRAPYTVRFKEQVQYKPDNCRFQWDFGDGLTSNELNPIHVFKDPGEYTIKLTIDYGLDQYVESKTAFIKVDEPHQNDFTAIYPKDRTYITDSTPFFFWKMSDDSTNLSYQDIRLATLSKKSSIKEVFVNNSMELQNIDHFLFYLNTNSDFSNIEPIMIEENYFEYVDTLQDDLEYYWMVRSISAESDTGLSNICSYKLNSKSSFPEVFSLKYPSPDTIVTTLKPKFEWYPAEDKDIDDQVTYELKLGKDPQQIETIYNGSEISYSLNTKLDENCTYYWFVEAKDKSGLTTKNEEGFMKFTTNARNDLPAMVKLLTPEEGEVFNSLRPSFHWIKSSDPDPEDEVTYRINYWWLGNPDNVIGYGVDTTYYKHRRFIDNSYFSWYVTSLDKNGGFVHSDTLTFGIDLEPEPPQNFAKIAPQNQTTLESYHVTFKWNRAIDPDPYDEISYELTYSQSISDPTVDKFIKTLSDTFYTVELDKNTDYEWQVKAIDKTEREIVSDEGHIYSFRTGSVESIIDGEKMPDRFFISSNYPNPFNPTTKLKYEIPARVRVNISIYNISGQLVDNLVNKNHEPGYYSISWNATNFSSGIYFFKIIARSLTSGIEYQKVSKGILVK